MKRKQKQECYRPLLLSLFFYFNEKNKSTLLNIPKNSEEYYSAQYNLGIIYKKQGQLLVNNRKTFPYLYQNRAIVKTLSCSRTPKKRRIGSRKIPLNFMTNSSV